jgi:hypothetical protein
VNAATRVHERSQQGACNRGIFVSGQAAAAISHVKSALERFNRMVEGSDDREFAVKGRGGG